MQRKFKTSVSLSADAVAILRHLMETMAISRSAVIEVLLRRAKKDAVQP